MATAEKLDEILARGLFAFINSATLSFDQTHPTFHPTFHPTLLAKSLIVFRLRSDKFKAFMSLYKNNGRHLISSVISV